MTEFFETKHTGGTGMPYHDHALPYLTVVLEGSYTEVFEGRPRAYERGAVVLHATGEQHADHFTAATRCLNAELLLHPGTAPGPVRLTRDVAAAADQLIDAYEGSDRSALDRSFANLRAVVERAPKDARGPRWLESVISFEEWVDAVPLHDLAKRCGVHPTHFSREFRRCTGWTPSDYRRRARVDVASKMLLNSDRSLAHIAASCGFTDQSHLNRAFALELRMSPGQYRRSFFR